jgi:hypothetical protein
MVDICRLADELIRRVYNILPLPTGPTLEE